MSEPTIQITEKQLAEQIEKGFIAGAKHAMENLAPQAMLALEEKLAARSTPKQGEAAMWVAARNGAYYYSWGKEKPKQSPWQDGPGNWFPLYGAPSVEPAGWVRVPVEPTDAMLDAATKTPGIKTVDGMLALHQARTGTMLRTWPGGGTPLLQAYRAMLAVAPKDHP